MLMLELTKYRLLLVSQWKIRLAYVCVSTKHVCVLSGKIRQVTCDP